MSGTIQHCELTAPLGARPKQCTAPPWLSERTAFPSVRVFGEGAGRYL